MSQKKRTHRQERLARVYDAEILPIWSRRFGRMILRGLTLPPKAMVLDVACGTGYPALEILRRLDEGGRIIAIDVSGFMLDEARRKAGELAGKRIFFRTENAFPRLSFADAVYDLVVCNLGLPEMGDPATAIAEFARVTKAGGKVMVALPLRGTWAELLDIYREVLTKHDQHGKLLLLERWLTTLAEPDEAASWMEAAGLEQVSLEIERYSLLFRSSREFFFAPIIEYGPLPQWKEIAGRGQEMQDVFWYIKEAIDAYFGGRAFPVTVVAGCLRGTVPVTGVRSMPLPPRTASPDAPRLPASGAQEVAAEVEVITSELDLGRALSDDDDDHDENAVGQRSASESSVCQPAGGSDEQRADDGQLDQDAGAAGGETDGDGDDSDDESTQPGEPPRK